MSRRRPIRQRPPGEAAALPESLPALLRRVYAARGVADADELSLELASIVPVSAFAALPGAVRRLILARERDERIVIVGDYDADGATSTALLMRVLPALGFRRPAYLVPSRFEYGYGLGPEVVELVAEQSPGLIITVDNGVASVDGVAAAAERGIDVLVTDHHLPGEHLPAACAIVNPNVPDEPFPHKHLAGVGVAFYLMAALARTLAERGEAPADAPRRVAAHLDLVALGTVADVVPLDRNNRVLVEQGLRRIRAGRGCPGIAALLRAGRRDPSAAVAADLGFVAGPRLNAAGRLTDMTVGIECLLTDDPRRASALAAELDGLNRERRALEARMREQAEAHLAGLLNGDGEYAGATLPAGLTLYRDDWHQGIVGLIASRIRERHHRPVVAFAPDADGMLKGSARSVPGLHMRDALERVAVSNPGLIPRFGGHAMAAGLSLPEANLTAFRQAFAALAADWLDETQLAGTLVTDGPLAPEELQLATAETLREAGPWGQAFEEPAFHGTFRVRDAREVGSGHLRLALEHPAGERPLGAIAFSCPAPWPERGDEVELVYRVQVNEYGGRRELQLMVEHLQPVAGQG